MTRKFTSIVDQASLDRANDLVFGKFKKPAFEFRDAMVLNPDDPNKAPDTLGEDGMRMIPHLLKFNKDLKELGATEEERLLIIDWVFMSAIEKKILIEEVMKEMELPGKDDKIH